MAKRSYTVLAERGVLAVSGPDRRSFLQGLISGDVERASDTRAIYSALLTAQGKYLFDFFIVEIGDVLVLDTERARLADLKRRLGLYKLRAQIGLDDASERFQVTALFGDDVLPALDLAEPGVARPLDGGALFADPRLPEAGARAVLPAASKAVAGFGFTSAGPDDYDLHRLGLGLPDGSRDLEIEKAVLLENGFEELNGVDFAKGCYLGQELTARTKYRALIKKRLVPVAIEGPAPAAGTIVRLNGEDVGEMRSSRNGFGLARLRLEAIDKAASGAVLAADGATLTPRQPAWARPS